MYATALILVKGKNTSFDWRQNLKIHPAADLFPLMAESELKELAENIKKNGLQQPILIKREHGVGDSFQDYLIDGRNRLDALAMLGWLGPQRERLHRERQDDYKRLLPLAVNYPKGSFSYHIRPYDESLEWRGFEIRTGLDEEDDVYRAVVSLNVHRRHLTPAQKRDLIAKVLKRDPEISDRQIGDTVNADHKTVGDVRAELEGRGEIPHAKARKDRKGRKQPSRKAKQEPKPEPNPQPVIPEEDHSSDPQDAEVSAEKRKAEFAAREQTKAELLANSGSYRGADQLTVFILATDIEKLFPEMSESARAGVIRFATEIAEQCATSNGGER